MTVIEPDGKVSRLDSAQPRQQVGRQRGGKQEVKKEVQILSQLKE